MIRNSLANYKTKSLGYLRRSKRSHRSDERGVIMITVIILCTIMLAVTALTVVAVASSSTQSQYVTSKQVAQATAQTGADLLFSALNATPSFPGTACTSSLCSDIFPLNISISPQSWYEVSSTGLSPCPTSSTGSGFSATTTTATCLQYSDQLAKITYSNTTGTGPQSGNPYVISLQVTVRTNCRIAGTTPTGCTYARLSQRIQPRQFSNYAQYTNSEMLDPSLAQNSYTTYESWYNSCTTGGSVKADTTVHGTSSGLNAVCPGPSHLNAPSANNNIYADTVNGPIATNDQTIFWCDVPGAPLNATVTPQAASLIPVTEDLVPSNPQGGSLCSGTPPTGTTRADSALPISATSLAQYASSNDTYTSDTFIALCGSSGGGNSTYLSTSKWSNGTSCSAPSGAASNAWPATGVIYVSGNAYVSGQACSGVTIAASGNIYIDNTLTSFRNHGVSSITCPGSIGLVSSNSVIVKPAYVGQTCQNQGPCFGSASPAQTMQCWPTTYDSNCMEIDAAIMALGYSGGAKIPAPGNLNNGCPYDAAVNKYSPVGYWPLTSTQVGDSTTSSGDMSGNSNNASWINGGFNSLSTSSSPIKCNSTDNVLNPSASHGVISTNNTLMSGIQYQQGTISAWINITNKATATGMIAGLGSSSTLGNFGDQLGLYLGANGTPAFAANSHGGSVSADSMNSIVGSSSTVSNGSWHLLTATWCSSSTTNPLANAGTASCPPGENLYIDGNLTSVSATPVWPTVLGGANYGWNLGQNLTGTSGNTWPNAITESGNTNTMSLGSGVNISRVAVYNTALNSTEITNMFNSASQQSTAASTGGSFYLDGWNTITPPAGTAFNSLQPKWTSSAVSPGNSMTAISCATTAWCLAGDSAGNVFLYNGTSWAKQTLPGTPGAISSIGCVGNNKCVVSSANGIYDVYQGTWVKQNISTTGSSIISCVTNSSWCIITNGTAQSQTASFPTSGAPNISATGSGVASLSALKCYSTSACYGFYWSGNNSYFTEWNGAAWSTGLMFSGLSGSNLGISFGSCLNTDIQVLNIASSCQIFDSNGSQYTFNIPTVSAYYSAATVSVGAGNTPGTACSVTTQGNALCWGDNAYGGIGNGTTTRMTSPSLVQVAGGGSALAGVTQIASGYEFTCAVVQGMAKCWGYNNYGQLGNGSTVNSSTPVQVSGLTSGVSQITTGRGTPCATLTSGSVKCWGWNSEGQLGNGSTVNSSTPVQVSGVTSGATSVSMGVDDSGAGNAVCSIVSGGARCWGGNFYGQLGNGSNTNSSTPVQVSGLTSGVGSISIGNNVGCATIGGSVKCWGAGTSGQLGNGGTANSNTPVQVSGLTSGVGSVSASNTPCAISAGAVYCWGTASTGGLGSGNITTNALIPVMVPGISSGATSISTGAQSSCAVVQSVPECWGTNGDGKLGNGTLVNSPYPVLVNGFVGSGDSFSQISGSNWMSNTCGVNSGGDVYCWGTGSTGSGSSLQSASITPLMITGLPSNGIAQVKDGGAHACALTKAGGLYCWGNNTYGQLGNGTLTSSPTPVVPSGMSSGVTSFDANYNETCAVKSSVTYCWGLGTSGQLGNGGTSNSNIPVVVSGSYNAQQISIGYSGSVCMLLTTNQPLCWGYNGNGQVGNGNYTNQTTPQAVSGLGVGRISSIAAGPYGTEAIGLSPSTSIYAWGYNGSGQLGNGNTTSYPTPQLIAGAAYGLISGYPGGVSYGNQSVCVAGTDYNLYCVGANSSGEFANNTTTNATGFTPGSGYTPGTIRAIAKGNGNTCILENFGPTVCSGTGTLLGQGSITGNALVPIALTGFEGGHPLLTGVSLSSISSISSSGITSSDQSNSTPLLLGTSSGSFLSYVTSNAGQGGSGGYYPLVNYVGMGNSINGISCDSVSSCFAIDGAGNILMYSVPSGYSCGNGVVASFASCALVVNGSITEAFRGATGLFSGTGTSSSGIPILTTGISENLTYDPYLQTNQAPYFLSPSRGAWQRVGSSFTGALQQ